MWNEFDKMVTQFFNIQEQMNRGQNFSGCQGQSWGYPQTDLKRNDDEVIFTAELPGVKKEDLTLDVKGNQLHLKGKKTSTTSEKEKVLHSERGKQGFDQTYKLPFVADPEKIEAKYENGVLEVKLQRAENDKPQSIEIN